MRVSYAVQLDSSSRAVQVSSDEACFMCVLHALRADRDARSTAKVNVLIRHIVMWKLNEGEGRTREQNASVLKQKLTLLDMAQHWLALAEQALKNAGAI